MAAEIVAGAFLSVVFERLIDKLLSIRNLGNWFKRKRSIEDQLKELTSKLTRASRLVHDAEERQFGDSDVKKWLDDVQDVVYRAQDLVDAIEARSKKEHRDQTGGETTVRCQMEEILKDLTDLLEGEVAGGLKEDNAQKGTTSSLSFTPERKDELIYGRNEDKRKILKLLLLDDIWGNKIGVLPIWGMGGLGKTTLAQQLYRDSSFKDRGFQLKAWVTVSTEFDVFRIMKILLEQIDPKTTHHDTEEPTKLQHKLKEALEGKKFFFVLDDVWDENPKNWDDLKSTFEFGKCESRIIVTTRSEKVAKNVASTKEIHELQQVLFDDCWGIFVDHAFNGDLNNADPQLQRIGKSIVKKCSGLPLAVKSVGGLLRSERDPKEWQKILDSNEWEEKNSYILPSLWLSYRNLPRCLKQCFAYCSVFPKDYQIDKKKLIFLWMAAGFLRPDDDEKKTMEDIGKKYIDFLISRSLFQRSSKHESKLVIHDLVHDLAMFVSGEFCFAYENKGNLKFLTRKTRHLSCRFFDVDLMKGIYEAKHLRTLIGSYRTFPGDFISELAKTHRSLRVLALSYVQRLPNSFNEMMNLRYLEFSYSEIEELPSTICDLYYLQTLLLSGCSRLIRLPTDLGRLINLRHLIITNTPLEEMPPQMGNLKQLQTLTDFVLGENKGSSIKELGELQHMGGELRISKLQNVNSKEDIPQANLMKRKKNLEKLVLEWGGDTIKDRGIEKEVFAALEPNTNLMELTVRGYKGSTFPNWVGDSSFSHIISVELTDHKHCLSLPPLGQLPRLQELVVEGFNKLETVSAEFYGNNPSISPFQCLETLIINHMLTWRRWLFSGVEKNGGCLPCLKRLCLFNCFSMESSPPLNQFPMLTELHLSDCWNLKELVANSPVVVETLEIWFCYKLEFLSLKQFTKLTNLSLVSCTDLKELVAESPNVVETLEIKECYKLESLVLNQFTKLTKLSLLGCMTLKELVAESLNVVETLEIKWCYKLESLLLNQFTKLIKPDSPNVSIGHVEICGSFDPLKSFPLDYFPRLERLVFGEREKLESLTFSKETGFALHQCLKYLRLDGCQSFRSLPEHMHSLLPSLSHLEIKDCPEIESFPQEGLPASLKTLVINNCCKLVAQHRHWELQRLTYLRDLNIANCDVVLDYFPQESFPTSLTSLILWHLPKLRSLNGSGLQHAASFEELSISRCEELQILPQEMLPSSLRSLYIYDSPLLERRYRKGTGEDWHMISHIPILNMAFWDLQSL